MVQAGSLVVAAVTATVGHVVGEALARHEPDLAAVVTPGPGWAGTGPAGAPGRPRVDVACVDVALSRVLGDGPGPRRPEEPGPHVDVAHEVVLTGDPGLLVPQRLVAVTLVALTGTAVLTAAAGWGRSAWGRRAPGRTGRRPAQPSTSGP